MFIVIKLTARFVTTKQVCSVLQRDKNRRSSTVIFSVAIFMLYDVLTDVH